MRRHIRRSRYRLLHLAGWRVRLVFWGGAVMVGLVSALFALGAEATDHIFRTITADRPWLPLITLPVGLGLISWVTHRFVSGARGSGIPQAIATLEDTRDYALRDAVLSLKVAFAKIALTLVGLLSGASIGREGPTVHIGAAIMYSLGKIAHFPGHYLDRGLIVAGGAAGVAAAFNTPLAGVMFAIEEISRSYDRRTGTVVLTAVIIAGLTAMVLLGNYHYFGTAETSFDLGAAWYAIIICGVLGGALGGGFAQTLIWSGRRIAPTYARHPVLVAAACGLVVALTGYVSGGTVYGTGYQEAKEIIDGGVAPDLAYPFLKIIATVGSYLSGIPGGIFAPSLSTGAGLGADLAHLFPDIPFTTIVLLGMVAYFAGVVQTPMTAFIIVMEMTNNQDMLIPLMAAAFIAAGTSRLICEKPIYAAMAEAFLASARPAQAAAGGGKGQV